LSAVKPTSPIFRNFIEWRHAPVAEQGNARNVIGTVPSLFNEREGGWADTGKSLATKTITRLPDGSITEQPYGNAKYFSFYRRSYPTLEAFADALWSATSAKTVFLIRGQLREGLHPRATHRRVWKDGDPKRTLDGPDRSWGVFDLDGAVVPEGLSFSRQLLAIRDKALPAEFNNVRMVATATSSTGRKAGLHARLYFRLAQPVANSILEHYAETLNAAAPGLHLDGSVFRAGMPPPAWFVLLMVTSAFRSAQCDLSACS
jgi:hypothetical protein